jgi:uncharacterized membrane protein
VRRERIEIIDALRGIAVVLMVVHHLLYDLVEFMGAPAWLFSNPAFDILHFIFAGLFIFLSGVSSRFSRSNVKRGLKVVAVALVITGVTWYMGFPILFGVLHLLGFCMLLYGLTRRAWDAISKPFAPVLYIALLVLSALAVSKITLPTPHLWILGWYSADFFSADYFPVFPWVFVFLLGTWAGYYIAENRLPARFYTARVPVFPKIGRRALVIYVLHQPVIYALVMLLVKATGR